MIYQPYSLNLPSSPLQPDRGHVGAESERGLPHLVASDRTYFLDYLHLVGRARQPKLDLHPGGYWETVDITLQH